MASPVRWVFALTLWWPTVFFAFKYGGFIGAGVYSLVALSSPVWLSLLAARLEGRVSPSAFRLVAAGGLITLAITFAVMYPLANKHAPGSGYGHGSDQDDALNLAGRALLRGDPLYRQRTYVGNPISPLPGAVLLAVPFVVLGTSALQGLFWVPVFAMVVYRTAHDRGLAVFMWLSVSVLCFAIVQQLVTGSDLFVNGIYVALSSVAMVRVVPDAAQPVWLRAASACMWGLALASRAAFFPMIPLVVYALAIRRGWKTALTFGAIGTSAMLGVMLPSFLDDPDGFTPLGTSRMLALSGRLSPVAGLTIYAVTLVCGLRLMRRRGGDLLLPSVVSLGVPIVALGLLYAAFYGWWATGSYRLYGLMVVPFVVLWVSGCRQAWTTGYGMRA